MKPKQVSLRYPPDKVDPRVEALQPHIQGDHEAMTVSHSRVLLMALLEGLDVLERRYGIAGE